MISCPACGSPLSTKPMHAGWVSATCRLPCPVQIYGKSEDSILKSLEDKDWVRDSMARYKEKTPA